MMEQLQLVGNILLLIAYLISMRQINNLRRERHRNRCYIAYLETVVDPVLLPSLKTSVEKEMQRYEEERWLLDQI